jgi:DNA-binding MarR family transcriptional regulator
MEQKPTPKLGIRSPVKLPCACATLRRASRVVTQLYDSELKATGLTITQFTLLQALDLASRVTQGQLGELLSIDSTTLSRTLRPLVKNRWIRSLAGEDRRERFLELTPLGAKQLEGALPHWQRAQNSLRTALGESGWKALQSINWQVVAAMDIV